MSTLIRNGTVVNAGGRARADVLVDGECIAAVGSGLAPGDATVVDATGLLVVPGGIDVHTHFDMPLGDLRTADDFESGTRAAACGGTTTVIDYATQARGGSLHQALDAWMERAARAAVVDFGFHMGVCDLGPGIEAEMDTLVAGGVPSFKLFMAYPGRLMLDDGDIFRVLRRTAANGGLVCLHAENGPVIDVLVREALAAGRTSPRFHAVTRPPLTEVEAVHRGIALAGMAEAPLYLVHVSTSGAVAEVAAARARGLPVRAETCPQYLCLTDEAYEEPGFDGAKYVMSPPLRPPGTQDVLWRGLASGDLDVVATDHCPFTLRQKAIGRGDFSRIPNGAPGVEWRMLLVYDGGVAAGRFPLERFVDVTSAGPARLFGLYPRKGTVAAGADADLVLIDPAGGTAISAAAHHTRADYDLYEGRRLRGAIEAVMSRGETIVFRGRFAGRAGRGRFLRRAPFDATRVQPGCLP